MKFYSRLDLVEEPAFITFWSYVHLLSGLLLFVLVSYSVKRLTGRDLVPWIAIMVASGIHALYECKDVYYSYIAKKRPENSNSYQNSIGDQLCASVGMLIGYLTIGTSCTPRDLLAVTIAYFNVYLLAVTMNYESLDTVSGSAEESCGASSIGDQKSD